MVDQKSKGRGPICNIRVFLNTLTTLHTRSNTFTPREKDSSSKLQFGIYVNGTRKRRNTFPIAKSPHWLSRKREPSSAGCSSLGPHSNTGTSIFFAKRETAHSFPKFPFAINNPYIFYDYIFHFIFLSH